jgi:hypothetical protein
MQGARWFHFSLASTRTTRTLKPLDADKPHWGFTSNDAEVFNLLSDFLKLTGDIAFFISSDKSQNCSTDSLIQHSTLLRIKHL